MIGMLVVKIDSSIISVCQILILMYVTVDSSHPGHGDEYSYHDDGTQTSVCLALPPPDSNVSFFSMSSTT